MIMRSPTHFTISAGFLLAAIVFLAAGCADLAAREDYPVRDLAVTMKCGTDVALRFNVSGNIGLRVQDMLASKCHLEGNGNNITTGVPLTAKETL